MELKEASVEVVLGGTGDEALLRLPLAARPAIEDGVVALVPLGRRGIAKRTGGARAVGVLHGICPTHSSAGCILLGIIRELGSKRTPFLFPLVRSS